VGLGAQPRPLTPPNTNADSVSCDKELSPLVQGTEFSAD
jgi:hypothetical protein